MTPASPPTPSLPAFTPPHTAAPQIIRQREPENLEFPFASLSTFITPSDQFYIRSHFPTPAIEANHWRLEISGRVNQKVEFTLDQLMKMPRQDRIATLECAGNGRIFLTPKVDGAQWEMGAVSTALWTGVPLSEVLVQAGIPSDAVDLIFQGADTGQPDEKPKPPGKIHYSHAIPVSKATDVLLAYAMNGKPLPRSHGFPLRAVVAGWYGMASVKWLTDIVVSDRPFTGYFQTVDYAFWVDHAGMPTRVPISEMQVKAQIARPAWHEVVAAGIEYRIIGAAWTGDSDVTQVEVSTDGGKHFATAALLGQPIPHAWRFWEYRWKTPATPGRHTLTARATDARGRTQPAERNADYGSYVIAHTLPMEVDVH